MGEDAKASTPIGASAASSSTRPAAGADFPCLRDECDRLHQLAGARREAQARTAIVQLPPLPPPAPMPPEGVCGPLPLNG